MKWSRLPDPSITSHDSSNFIFYFIFYFNVNDSQEDQGFIGRNWDDI